MCPDTCGVRFGVRLVRGVPLGPQYPVSRVNPHESPNRCQEVRFSRRTRGSTSDCPRARRMPTPQNPRPEAQSQSSVYSVYRSFFGGPGGSLLQVPPLLCRHQRERGDEHPHSETVPLAAQKKQGQRGSHAKQEGEGKWPENHGYSISAIAVSGESSLRFPRVSSQSAIRGFHLDGGDAHVSPISEIGFTPDVAIGADDDSQH